MAEYLSEKGFYIPSGLGLTDDDLETVIEKNNRLNLE